MNELARPWVASEGNIIPAKETAIDKIVVYGNTNLTEKQQNQIIRAFQMEAFDMAAEYAWKKAILNLRNSLSNLGMDFIAEFVQRDDVDDFTPIENVLTERATIDLAERLGVINATGALKLRQAQELVNHYMSGSSDEEMSATDSIYIIKPCIEYILSDADVSVAVAFSEFRQRLLNEDLVITDPSVEQILNSPLFYIRTVNTILLTAIKKTKQATQEHALANMALFLPEIWSKLASSDKWSIGEVYRDVVASGDTVATKGLKLALGKVGGFDYVPETLRSSTFRELARKLIDVHDSFNNFYNETKVVKALSCLGTRIPEPAFKICIDAYLLVYLGNYYGWSCEAAPIAKEELLKITKDRWGAYFADIIHTDDRILSNLERKHQVERFQGLLLELGLVDLTGLPKCNQALYNALLSGNVDKTTKIATYLYKQLI